MRVLGRDPPAVHGLRSPARLSDDGGRLQVASSPHRRPSSGLNRYWWPRFNLVLEAVADGSPECAASVAKACFLAACAITQLLGRYVARFPRRPPHR